MEELTRGSIRAQRQLRRAWVLQRQRSPEAREDRITARGHSDARSGSARLDPNEGAAGAGRRKSVERGSGVRDTLLAIISLSPSSRQVPGAPERSRGTRGRVTSGNG